MANFVKIGTSIINLELIIGVDLELDLEAAVEAHLLTSKSIQEEREAYEKRFHARHGALPRDYGAILVYFNSRVHLRFGEEAQELLDFIKAEEIPFNPEHKKGKAR